jgi:LPXTG-motif cell wall-anchored protein
VTDKDANPDIIYGPGTFTADEQGSICLDVFEAPAGLWKIDVVGQGSGSTDSKVFLVEGGIRSLCRRPRPRWRLRPHRQPPRRQQRQRRQGRQHRLRPQRRRQTPIAPPATEPGSVTRPFDELPWVIQEVETSTGAASIPATGGTGAIPFGIAAIALLGSGGLVIVTTRRRGRPEAL